MQHHKQVLGHHNTHDQPFRYQYQRIRELRMLTKTFSSTRPLPRAVHCLKLRAVLSLRMAAKATCTDTRAQCCRGASCSIEKECQRHVRKQAMSARSQYPGAYV